MAENFIDLPAGLLRRLHHLQSQVADLQAQLDRGPRQVAAAQAIVDKSIAAREAARDAVKAATIQANERQLHLKEREAKVTALEGQLNSAGTNKEFALLKEQIAADKKANEVLNDEIFEILEHIDGLNEVVATIEAELKEHQDQKATREAAVEERLKIVRVDLDDTLAQLEAEAAKLPGDVRQLYDRLVGALGPDAMADAEGSSCGNCNQTLRTQIIDHLQLRRLNQCPNCHAMLYLAND